MTHPIILTAGGPLDWSGLLDFYRRRALPGIEEVTETAYRRRVGAEWLEVSAVDGAPQARVTLPDGIGPERIVHMFDLNADSVKIARHIGFAHAWLPGCWDRFELAVRAVLGQQISVGAARTFAGRLVTLCGAGDFPTAEALANADLTTVGLTAKRALTLRLLAEAVMRGGMDYRAAALMQVPGIGPWTAQYIAMRALKDADAFPASDLVLRKKLGLSERELVARMEALRPYQAYAVIQIWRM